MNNTKTDISNNEVKKFQNEKPLLEKKRRRNQLAK